MTDVILAVAAAAGIPSAVVGFLVWSMQRKIVKQEQAREAKERDREELEICLIESVNATMALSEATAKAVQRIPDAHCNGDMHAALAYEEGVKHKQRDFLMKKGVHSIL